MQSGKEIREAIEARRDLATAIVQHQWKVRPDLERRYGPSGFSKCLEDAHFHLQYLAEAIEASEPALFVDYVAWAKVMLASRNVPSEDLANTLQVLRDVLVKQLPNEMHDLVCSFVNRALERLPQYPSLIPSLFQEGEPLVALGSSYLHALLRYERHTAVKLVEDAVDGGTPIKDIYCHVFERCQREIGRLWQMNKVTVAQEHYCTASTQLVMALLYPRIFAGRRERVGSVVAACVPGELHEIGARILCDLLEMEGWDTIYLGASVPVAGLLETVKARNPDVLAISASMTFHIKPVRELISAVRNSSNAKLPIAVGGYAFQVAPNLWRDVGADGFAEDARQAIELVKRLRS